MHKLFRIVFLFILILVLYACGTVPVENNREELFKTSKEIEDNISSKGFENVYIRFKHDSYEVEDDQKKQFEEISTALRGVKRNNDEVFLLVGHTDSTGDAAYNLKLSQKRANAVKNELIKKYNISEESIFIDGKGETQLLISPEKTRNDRMLNRRVEILLTERTFASTSVGTIEKTLEDGKVILKSENSQKRIGRLENGRLHGKTVCIHPNGHRETEYWYKGKNVTAYVKNCRIANPIAEAHKGLTAGINFIAAFFRGDNPVEAGAWGYNAASKQKFIKAIDMTCDELLKEFER